MQTISAILVARCSDTIPAQNWLNARCGKVCMVRIAWSNGFDSCGKGGARQNGQGMDFEKNRRENAKKNEIARETGARNRQRVDLSLLSKFIICPGQIAEFDPAQPKIPN